MVTLGIMVAGAIISATVFSAANYGFSHIDKRQKSDEKRHNLAAEKFNNDKEKFDEQKEAYDDWTFSRSMAKKEADGDFNDVDRSLAFYNQMHPDRPAFKNIEPKFSNYYKPSPSQKNGELIYVSIGMLGAGYLVSKLI